MTKTYAVTFSFPAPIKRWALGRHSEGALERVAELARLGDDYWSQPMPERGWLDLVCRTAEPRRAWTRRDLEDFGLAYFANPRPDAQQVREFVRGAAAICGDGGRERA
jgi:hypothetical protein